MYISLSLFLSLSLSLFLSFSLSLLLSSSACTPGSRMLTRRWLPWSSRSSASPPGCHTCRPTSHVSSSAPRNCWPVSPAQPNNTINNTLGSADARASRLCLQTPTPTHAPNGRRPTAAWTSCSP